MDATTAFVTITVALIGGVPATIAAIASLHTRTMVSRNGHRDSGKPTLPDRIGTVGGQVDNVDAKLDAVIAKVDSIAEVQDSQGRQIRALWRHVRRDGGLPD